MGPLLRGSMPRLLHLPAASGSSAGERGAAADAVHRPRRLVYPLLGCSPLGGAAGGARFVRSTDWPPAAATAGGTWTDETPSAALALSDSQWQERERGMDGGQEAPLGWRSGGARARPGCGGRGAPRRPRSRCARALQPLPPRGGSVVVAATALLRAPVPRRPATGAACGTGGPPPHAPPLPPVWPRSARARQLACTRRRRCSKRPAAAGR